MIKVNLKCSDDLKSIFEDIDHLVVRNTPDDAPYRALLIWLASGNDGLWISYEPKKAQAELAALFAQYPLIHFNHIKFLRPTELQSEKFSRCVVEGDLDITHWTNMYADNLRILQPCAEVVHTPKTINMSIEDKRELLEAIRNGATDEYNEYEVLASLCRESFYDFIVEFWDEIIAELFVDNWHIEYIANELQIVAERVFEWKPKEYDLIINISPGTTKSTLCSIMFPAWVWIRLPSGRIIGGSYADTLAMDLSRKNRDLVMSPKYQRTFPNLRLRQDQKAKSHFVNTNGGSRYSFGVSGTVTGMHAHFIIIDDPLNPNEAVSEVELENANRLMSETLFTRKIDKAITPTILIMQRLHQNDPTQHVLDTYETVRHICLPAESVDEIKPPDLKKYYVDGLMDPNRLSQKVLRENFKALGEFGYAGQFGQRPVPRGGAMFKPGRITVDTAPVRWKARIRYWDKAGTQNAGAYTAGVLMGKDMDDRFWILDVVRGRWAMEEREATIKNTAAIDGHQVRVWIEQEPGSGGKDQAMYTIKNLAGYRIQAEKVGSATGNKVSRAGPFADQVNSGNVYMITAGWNAEFLDEHRFFPASKYKDQVDAASGAFNKLVKGVIHVGAL